MDDRGLNDRALSERVRAVTRSQISRIRRGGRASPKTAEALAELTGIPAADFVFRPDPSNSALSDAHA